MFKIGEKVYCPVYEDSGAFDRIETTWVRAMHFMPDAKPNTWYLVHCNGADRLRPATEVFSTEEGAKRAAYIAVRKKASELYESVRGLKQSVKK